ncbi:MAG: tetratricopeptide repeat protein [bacterium]|nr:tetratricopeptide repeat protein [bacterium]
MKLILSFSLIILCAALVRAQPCADAARQVKTVLSSEAAKTYEANLAIAREAYSKNPQIAEELIWYGRRIAYTGEYKEAIKIFTEGVSKFSTDARMYRHRGHRYFTLRCFDDAIRDFETAAKLIKGKPDSVEPNGMPNARNIPTSTLQSNIWYHLGLAYYLKGDFKKAARAYAECQKVSKNNDMLVATVYWRYMTLRRLGKAKEAKRLLDSLPKDLDVIENEDYLKLIKLNRSEERPENLLSTIKGDANTLGSASLGYGIGNYFLYNGDREKAMTIFRKIVEGDQWASFGYIAAEVELARQPSK